jgi:hypothetical protein
VKVGIAVLHPLCLQMRNISPHHCLNPLHFLIFDSETANDPVLHAKPHIALRNTVAQLLGVTAKSQLWEVGTSAKYLMEMFLSST